MKNYYLLVVAFFIFCLSSFSQITDSSYVFEKNGIIKPNILSTHPFGIFISRLQGNFKTHAPTKTTLKLGLESGNVWAAPVTAYIPNDKNVREIVKKIVWHKTQFLIDVDTLDAKTMTLQFDGVIKGFTLQTNFKLGEEHELDVDFRAFSLSNGNFPFSVLTSDDFIESFHTNIAGGDDPFGRKLFGLNNAGIFYKDTHDNTLEFNKGDIIIGGFKTSYYYYPKQLINKNETFHVNFGAHLGANLSKYNSSVDLGLSSNAIKQYALNDRNSLNFGLNLGVLRKNVIEFNDDNVELGNNNFIGNLESIVEFSFVSKGKTTHSFGADFYFQTSLNKRDEFNYLIPIRNGVTEKSWVTGVSHLYKHNNYWTFLYSFTRKITTTFYLQQDLTLNNNPDIQTGISIEFSL